MNIYVLLSPVSVLLEIKKQNETGSETNSQHHLEARNHLVPHVVISTKGRSNVNVIGDQRRAS
jgi:hypothetical protein